MRKRTTKTTNSDAEGLWIHPAAHRLPFAHQGPFVKRTDGAILCIDESEAHVSRDAGATWSSCGPLFPNGDPIRVSNERALLATREGTVVAAFMNLEERHWTWDDDLHDAPGARLPTYVMRSLDGGRTWQDLQKLHDDWTGAVRDMIQTTRGRIVLAAMKLLHDPGRHAVITYSSTDNARTWEPANLLDLGGTGHHGGITEPTLTELRDGRVWMLIRTNWGEFWSAWSCDGGRFWRIVQPSGIPASSAPAFLKRLESGRLALLWNRPNPSDRDDWPLTGGDGLWSETPVSNYREELSAALSDDDGQTWTPPVVIARHPGTWIAYPYLFEADPGTLWITTMQGTLRIAIPEQALL